MNVDLSNILEAAGGALTAIAAPFCYAYNALRAMSSANADDIAKNAKDFADFKIEVGKNYVPRGEIDRKFEMVREDIKAVGQNIKDSAAELKDFIDAKMGDK